MADVIFTDDSAGIADDFRGKLAFLLAKPPDQVLSQCRRQGLSPVIAIWLCPESRSDRSTP